MDACSDSSLRAGKVCVEEYETGYTVIASERGNTGHLALRLDCHALRARNDEQLMIHATMPARNEENYLSSASEIKNIHNL